MRYLLTSLAGFALLAVSAEAQQYRCENGELVGGEAGVTARCTTNKSGQIVSVTPYKPVTRQTVRIYPNNQIRSQPVQTYTPKGKRVYAPAPLTPQTNIPPTSIVRPSYTTRTVAPAGTTPRYRPVKHVRATQPQIITTVPTPRIQRAAYAAPCTFKIREVNMRGNRNAYEVCHTDIEPTNKRSIRKLYSRLKKASRRACGTDYDSILTRWSQENSRCAAVSLDRAVMTSGIDPLRAYHLSKTGRSVPRVTIGAPRDAS